MRKIREVLRLKHACGLSNTRIAISCNISRETVRKYLQRAAEKELTWPLPTTLDDADLEKLLFPREVHNYQLSLPNWAWVHQELKRKGVTRWLLWEEYKSRQPDGISYSRFCEYYRRFQLTLKVSMRQIHKAGEKCFVDYASMTLPWVDKTTGEIHQAQIFVAVLGASNYTFVEATHTQSLSDWIHSHVHAFIYFNGCPEIIVPDNLASGVTRAHHYDPDINPTYQEMADYYGVAIIPARVRKPKDKSKAEVGVQYVERFILAKLRNRTFFSVAEMNVAIQGLLTEYNNKPFQKLPGSRLSQFEAVDKPALKSLPIKSYEYAQWQKARVNIDYHIAIDQHYYSVPHQHVGLQIECRVTATLVECFYKRRSIAVHRRSYKKHGYTTVKAHMPKRHQHYAQWTPQRLCQWAEKTGPQTTTFILKLMQARVHPQQAFRACLGVMRLSKTYGATRLENAAKRALDINSLSYKSIASILKHNLDQKALPEQANPTKQKTLTHDNIRGSDYYH